MLYAVVGELFSEVVRRGDDIVCKVGVVYHHGPHFGFSNSIGKIIVFMNFNGVGNIPGMKPIQECGNNGTKAEGNDVGNTHIFTAVHDLDGGDMKLFAKT